MARSIKSLTKIGQLNDTIIKASKTSFLEVPVMKNVIARPKTVIGPGCSIETKERLKKIREDTQITSNDSPSSIILSKLKNRALEENTINYTTRTSTTNLDTYSNDKLCRSSNSSTLERDAKLPSSCSESMTANQYEQNTKPEHFNSYSAALASSYVTSGQSKVTETVKKSTHYALDREDEQAEATDYSPDKTDSHIKEGEESIKDRATSNALKINRVDNKVLMSCKSFQDTVEVDLNELGVPKTEKKALSMDINVTVRVKPPGTAKENEIGFHNYSEEKKNKEMKNNISLLCKSEDVGQMSQNDLTEEIRKVYHFFKDTAESKHSPLIENPKSSDLFLHFDKVKNFYFKVITCVKAFKELNGIAQKEVTSEHNSLLVNSNENYESKALVNAFDNYRYPIEFNKVEYDCSKSGGTDMNKQFLGRKSLSVMNLRMYSSKGSGSNKADCIKAKKLPCLQSSELHKRKDEPTARTVCEKLCMPCCKPARDPPTCFYPYHKPACKKDKPPRPAFSECKLNFELKNVVPCECVRARVQSCKPSKDSEKCVK